MGVVAEFHRSGVITGDAEGVSPPAGCLCFPQAPDQLAHHRIHPFNVPHLPGTSALDKGVTRQSLAERHEEQCA